MNNFRELRQDSRGNTLFVTDNPVGGHTYWSDEIGGGVMVWDTCLVSEEMLKLAIKAENDFEQSFGSLNQETGQGDL